jgi:hypothetical protein
MNLYVLGVGRQAPGSTFRTGMLEFLSVSSPLLPGPTGKQGSQELLGLLELVKNRNLDRAGGRQKRTRSRLGYP